MAPLIVILPKIILVNRNVQDLTTFSLQQTEQQLRQHYNKAIRKMISNLL